MSSQLPLPFELRDDYKLSAFVRGANVELCDRLLSLLPGATEGQALWMHGDPGCGKTHLLQALVAQLSEQGAVVAYLPASALPREEVAAVLEGSERYSLLVIDDIQAWFGDQSTERELVRLYQERRQLGLHLVMAAAHSPLEYQMALPDWQSRARGAQVFKLAQLSDAGKLEVLVARSARLGLELSESVATYLLRHGPRSLPQMLAVLGRVDKLALAEQRRLTVPLLKKALASEPQSALPASGRP